MASGYVQVPVDSTGKRVDCVSLSAGGASVVRQTIVVADPTSSAGFATVTGGRLNVNASVGTVTVTGQVSVTGSVAISNTVTVQGNVSATIIGTIPNINVSTMPAVVLAAGTANIGTIQAVSATVTVQGNINISTMPAMNISSMPNVVLAAGATLDGISKTVNVVVTNAINISSMPAISIGPISTIDRISATVLAAITNKISIDNISATVLVSGSFTVGSQTAGQSVTAANSLTLIGGYDGSFARVALTDAGGKFVITGTVALAAGGATIDKISATASVVIAAGTANIGTVNGISATVLAAVTGTVNISGTPSVVLAAGTANIGTVNGISATIAAVLAAGTANIGTINGISATVVMSGVITNTVNVNLAAQSGGFIVFAQGGTSYNVSVTAGNAPILAGGRVKSSISSTAGNKTATWAWFDKAGHQIVQLNAASLHPSATHGPKTVTLSASANTVLVASAGTACIFVDSIMVTGNLAAVTRCDVYETASSAAPEVSAYIGVGGGGFTQKFDPPWQISAGQALSARLKPSASAQVLVTVHFHVGPN